MKSLLKFISPQRRSGGLVDFHLVVSRRSSRAVAVYIAREMLWNESLVQCILGSNIVAFVCADNWLYESRRIQHSLPTIWFGAFLSVSFLCFCRLFIWLNHLDLKEEEDTEDRSTANKEKASKIDWWDKIWKDKRGNKKQDINLDKLGWNMIVYQAGLPAR